MATSPSLNTLKDTLVHLKKKLERTTDDETILRVIHKLSKIPITIDLLQGTGAGKIMRVLAKKHGSVGSKAASLLNKWRDIVANSQKTSETSSLKENDHPKELLEHTSSKTKNKTEKAAKSFERFSEEKTDLSFKDKQSKKEKHNKERYDEKRHTNHENSKEKLKNLSKEEKRSKDKHSGKRLINEEFEHDYKKKHVREKDGKFEQKYEYSRHSIKHYGESSLDKKKIDKNKLNSPSKSEKQFSKEVTFTQKDHSIESGICNSEYPVSLLFTDEHKLPGSNESESAHNSDSSVSYENSPKKLKTSESDSYKYNNEFKKKKSSESFMNSSKEKKNFKEFEKSLKKKIVNGSDSNIQIEPSEKISKERLHSKSKVKKTTKKDLKMLSTEEFTSSEALFEDCLNFNDIVPLKKKKSSKSVSNCLPKKAKEHSINLENNKKLKTSHETCSPISKEKEKIEWKVTEEMEEKSASPEKRIDIASTLPQTQPNYRPLPQRNYDFSPIKKKENMSNEDAIKFTSSRKEKTAVYSGRKNKNNYLTAVPTLFECCTRVLIENIDDIEYMGEIPFFLLESMLQRCTPTQLYRIEDYNPYLIEDTKELWEIHCRRDFRTCKREENETWRDLYWRSHDEREQRLRSVTANISAQIANSNPTRKAKLAYVDSVVKPPRDVARKQAKHGTALPTNHTVKAGPPSKASPRPTAPSINSAKSVASTSRPRVEAKPMKPKIAPLMAKTLKSMKKCFRR